MFEKRMPFLISLIVIALIIAPYLFAAQMTDSDFVFGGFLINPVDGHSYLAKMQQGLRGGLRFTLPYTADPGDGAYLFLFYLGLGHISRILNLPVLFVFHGFRILGAMLLLGVLYKLNIKLFKDKRYQNLGFAISALGSGLGWIAIFAGLFTSDFWVAEAYPFLSMYTNPHFSIGLSLMILTLFPGKRRSILVELILGLSLGIIQPFAVVIILIVKIGILVFNFGGTSRKLREIFSEAGFIPTIAFGLGGGLILIYQYWSILSDPILALWNAQNITQSPGIFDLFMSLSPPLILAGFGIRTAWKESSGKVLVIWALVSLILVLIPWNLQRRFLTGIYVPLAGLSVYGLIDLERKQRLSFRYSLILILILIIPTNAIILASGIQAAAKHDPKVYQKKELYDGLEWINENTPPDALILSNEETGLFIPSITGRKVVYGHPFETVNAEDELKFLREFLDETQDDNFYEKSIKDRKVDALFLSSDISDSLERWLTLNGFSIDYENELVRIFRMEQ